MGNIIILFSDLYQFSFTLKKTTNTIQLIPKFIKYFNYRYKYLINLNNSINFELPIGAYKNIFFFLESRYSNYWEFQVIKYIPTFINKI